jgi:hypothetical protein
MISLRRDITAWSAAGIFTDMMRLFDLLQKPAGSARFSAFPRLLRAVPAVDMHQGISRVCSAINCLLERGA